MDRVAIKQLPVQNQPIWQDQLPFLPFLLFSPILKIGHVPSLASKKKEIQSNITIYDKEGVADTIFLLMVSRSPRTEQFAYSYLYRKHGVQMI